MKKGLSILTLSLVILTMLAVSTVAIKTTTVADGWYRYDDTFSKNDCEYRLRGANLEDVDSEAESYTDGIVMIKRTCGDEELSKTVPFGECKTNDQRKWCFLNASYENSNVDIDARGNLQPGIKMLMEEYSYLHDLDYSRTFSTTKMNLEDEVQVTIRLENNGDIPLYDIAIKEPVPEGFEVVSKDDSFHHVTSERELRSTSTLFPDKTLEKTYTLKASEYTASSTKTAITFNTEEQTGLSLSPSSKTLEVISPYEISMTSLNKNIPKDDSRQFSITINNKENEELTIENLKVRIPSNIKTSSYSPLDDISSSEYEFSGTIPASTKKTFPVEMSFPFVGEFEVSYDARLTVKDREYHERDSTSITVSTDHPTCSVDLTPGQADAGSSITYNSKLAYNTGQETFYDINCTHNDPLTGMRTLNDRNIRTGDQLTVASGETKLPLTTHHDNYTFELDCTYRTDGNQWFECSDKTVLDVKPAERFINLSVNLSSDNATVGETVDVTVTARSDTQSEIDMPTTISDDYGPAVLTAGTDSATIELIAPNTTVQLYSYTINITPDTQDPLRLNHTITIADMNYTDVQESTIHIMPIETGNETGEVAATGSEAEGEATANGDENADPSDLTFVDKVIKLFKSIFG